MRTERVKDRLVAELENVIGVKIVSVHADVNTQTGEGLMAFTLNQKAGWEQGPQRTEPLQ